jgi:hypothetical protein
MSVTRDGNLSLFLKIKFQLNDHFSVKPKILVFNLYLNDKFCSQFTVSSDKFKNNEMLITLFFKIKIKYHPYLLLF